MTDFKRKGGLRTVHRSCHPPGLLCAFSLLAPPPPPPFPLALLPPKSSLPKHLMPVGVSVKLQTLFGDDAPQLILLDVLDGCFVI